MKLIQTRIEFKDYEDNFGIHIYLPDSGDNYIDKPSHVLQRDKNRNHKG